MVHLESYIQQKYLSGKKRRKIKTFSDEGFIMNRRTLKKWLKEVLETERNDERRNLEYQEERKGN